MANEPPHIPQVGPVRFNDSEDDFFQSQNQYPNAPLQSPPPVPDDGRKTYNDKSSIMTGWTSGITVPLHEPVDEKGQTHAQAIVNEYSARGSRIEGSGSPSNSMPRPYPNERRPQSTHLSVADAKSLGPVSE